MAKGANVAIAHPIKKNLAKESRNCGVLLSISNCSNFLYVLLKINLEITTVILTNGKNITVTNNILSMRGPIRGTSGIPNSLVYHDRMMSAYI
jgi:hypothetical protein